jgi:hypothetical protein
MEQSPLTEAVVTSVFSSIICWVGRTITFSAAAAVAEAPGNNSPKMEFVERFSRGERISLIRLCASRLKTLGTVGSSILLGITCGLA